MWDRIKQIVGWPWEGDAAYAEANRQVAAYEEFIARADAAYLDFVYRINDMERIFDQIIDAIRAEILAKYGQDAMDWEE